MSKRDIFGRVAVRTNMHGQPLRQEDKDAQRKRRDESFVNSQCHADRFVDRMIGRKWNWERP